MCNCTINSPTIKVVCVMIFAPMVDTNLASRWEGVRLHRASGKSTDFPGSSLSFRGSSPATSLEVLPLWNLTVPRKFPRLSQKFPDFPGGQPSSLKKPDILFRLTKTFSDLGVMRSAPTPTQIHFLRKHRSCLNHSHFNFQNLAGISGPRKKI